MEARRVEEDHFWKYRAWAIKEALSKKTVYSHLVILKQAFKWATRKRFVLRNPFADAEITEPAPTKQVCPTAEQVAAILAAAQEWDRPLFAFLAYTGCRIGEARELLWEDVSLPAGGGGHIVISRGGYDDTTKSGKVRRIPVHPALRPYLEALPRDTKHVFRRAPSAFDPDGLGPLNDRKVLNRLKAICKKLNFPNHEKFTVHSLRHFFCSQLAMEGAPERYVKGLLGHSSSEIVDLYFEMYDKAAHEFVARIKVPSIPPPAPPAPPAAEQGAI